MTSDTHPPGPDAAEAPSAEDLAPLGGRPRAILFPPFWHRWFARQSEPRLAALDELVEAHLERRMLRDALGRLKHAVVIAFLAAAAGAHWFSDQIAWLAERLPVLKLAWRLITGSS